MLLSQLNEANEQNTELLNLLQGLEETTKVYPMKIKLYEQKEKEIRKSLRNNKWIKRK